ncbi:ATP-binding protein [Streptomyces sp. ISL-96]|uniref:ATP-binding protein n=1 Tax=Streptomyces sp. ISL-96 TaxID=2819191 RepID=UPI001BE72C1F|nr:ATP-binding protein [Streptomyces sp. ISL-96]MBT2493867.1 ATP-binding protein [Streptomyces sp. ISL-96]
MHGYEVTEPRLRCVLPFEAEPAELHVLRAAVREQLTRWGIQSLADEVQLVVTELATNVIKHVGEGAAATLVMESAEDRLRVELHDKSHVVPSPAEPECGDECGRGLHLLTALAVDWGTVLTATGKAVWCELALGPDEQCRRIRRASVVLDGYRRMTGAYGFASVGRLPVLEESATDLIADLLHWLAAQGSDPDGVLDRAQMHFEADAA